MEWMVGVYDLYAFSAITRRWMFWLVAASIPLGLAVMLAHLVAYLAG